MVKIAQRLFARNREWRKEGGLSDDFGRWSALQSNIQRYTVGIDKSRNFNHE